MLLEKNKFFVKEQIQGLKMGGTYDIFDPETNQQIAVAKEEPSLLVTLLKMFIEKKHLPTKVTVYENDQEVFIIKKPVTFLRSEVSVLKSTGEVLGTIKSVLFSLKKTLFVYDASGQEAFEVRVGDKWGEFKFLDKKNGNELGTVTKKFAGFAKELFTSADNYLISVNDESVNIDTKTLIFAAGLAFDRFYKES